MRAVKRAKAGAARPKPASRRGQPSWVVSRPRRPLRTRARHSRFAALWTTMAAVSERPRLYGGLAGAIAIAGLAAWFVLGGHAAALAAGAAALADRELARAGFVVRTVAIAGADRTAPADIAAALGTAAGASIFELDAAAARERIEGLPWVREARVRRIFPDRIAVQVSERQPSALWQMGGRLTLIDPTGAPITREGLAAYAHLPLVVGPGAPQAAQALITALETAPLVRSAMAAAIRNGERRWDLKLKSGIIVRLPEQGLDAALSELTHILGRNPAVLNDAEAVDLRFGDRIVIRLKGSAAERVLRGQTT